MAKLKNKLSYLLALVVPAFAATSTLADDQPKAAGSEEEAKKEAMGSNPILDEVLKIKGAMANLPSLSMAGKMYYKSTREDQEDGIELPAAHAQNKAGVGFAEALPDNTEDTVAHKELAAQLPDRGAFFPKAPLQIGKEEGALQQGLVELRGMTRFRCEDPAGGVIDLRARRKNHRPTDRADASPKFAIYEICDAPEAQAEWS